MFVLMRSYHECKESYVTTSLVGVYQTRADVEQAMLKEFDSVPKEYKYEWSDEDDNRWYVKSECCDLWEWAVYDTDGLKEHCFWADKYEFGFDEE